MRRIGLACLGLVLSAPGYACSRYYPYGSARTVAAVSTVIFEGVAVGTRLDDPRSLLASAELDDNERRDLRSQTYFRVTRIWKGNPGHIALVRQLGLALMMDSDPQLRLELEMGVPQAALSALPLSYWCGTPSFEFGERYLVFARIDGGGELQEIVRVDNVLRRIPSGGVSGAPHNVSTYEELFQRMIERGDLPPSRVPGRVVPRE